MKYLIEIEDEPIAEGLWKAKNFKSLVFDEYGLSMLQKLDIEDEKLDIEEEKMKAFKKGMEGAWKVARKVCCDEDDGGLTRREFDNIFGSTCSPDEILMLCTADQAMEKIATYMADKRSVVKGRLHLIEKETGFSLKEILEILKEME